MKTKLFRVAVCIVILCCISVGVIYALYDNGYFGCTFEVSEYGSLEVKGKTRGHFVFPNEVDGKQINELTPGCLRKQKGITAVTVPDGITEMDLSIILCENVRELYFGKDLNNIVYPMIGSRNLEKIVVDANNPYYFVDNGCLIDRRNNHLILAAKNARIPEYVTWISYFSFGHHHLTEDLIIPDGVKELDEYAFAGLTGNVNVYVPESTQLFGSSFSGCSKSITFWFGNKDSKVGNWMAEQGYTVFFGKKPAE
ncbi:MAG: leucine-rich repeat protein [Clostridia bacterium]|nr:leucine-rich repeat protein [Clostridia bacterium]